MSTPTLRRPAHDASGFDRVDKAFGRVSTALAWIAGLAAVALIVNVATDVLLRTLVGAPVPGTNEIITVIWMPVAIALVFGLLQRTNQNIAVDLLIDAAPPHVRRWASLVNGLCAAFAVVLLGVFAVTSALHATAIGQTTTGQVAVPVWPGKWVVAIGMAALLVEVMLTTVRTMLRPETAAEPAPDDEEGAVL